MRTTRGLQRHRCQAPSATLLVILVAGLLVPSPTLAAPTPITIATRLASAAAGGDLAVDGLNMRHVVWLEPGAGVKYQTDATGPWVARTLSTDVDAGSPVIAVDGSRKAHVAWTVGGGTNSGLYYATNRTGTWAVTRVTAEAASDPAIAVDPLGEVHVALVGAGGLEYVTNRRGFWTKTIPDAGSCAAPTIILDAGRHPHIVYERYSYGGLVHATDASGAWVKKSISSGFDIRPAAAFRSGTLRIVFDRMTSSGWSLFRGTYTTTWSFAKVLSDPTPEPPDLIVDAAGKSHIVAGSRYISDASGSWVAQEIGPGLASIALGPDGVRHFLMVKGSMYLADTAASRWKTETVTSTTSTLYPALSVGPDGKVRIVHEGSGFATPGLRHALQGDTAWTRTRITMVEDQKPAIAVDGNGASHVTFVRHPAIWYGVNATGTWVFTRIGQAPVYGYVRCPRIAVGPTGHTFVTASLVTAGGSSSDVLLTDRSGTWTSVPLPGAGDQGCPEIAVDANDRAHLVYFGDDGFRYLNDVGGSLAVRSSFGSPEGGPVDIALDAAGKVHVAYENDVRGTVRYRTNVSGSWATSIVVTGGTGRSGSLDVVAPASGVVRIVYRGPDADPGLHVATRSATEWAVIRFVSGDRNEYDVPVDVAALPNGRIRITYDKIGVGVVVVGD